MSDEKKCGTRCITPSFCHAHYCNRIVTPTPDPRERGECECNESGFAQSECIRNGCRAIPPARPVGAEPVAWELDGDQDQNFATVAITERGRAHALATGESVRRPLYAHPAPAPVVSEAMVERIVRAVEAEFSRDFRKQSEHEEDCDGHPCRCDKDIQGIVRVHNASRRNFLARLPRVVSAALTPDAEGGR